MGSDPLGEWTNCNTAVFMFLPSRPILTFLSRVLWIYLNQKFDPERF